VSHLEENLRGETTGAIAQHEINAEDIDELKARVESRVHSQNIRFAAGTTPPERDFQYDTKDNLFLWMDTSLTGNWVLKYWNSDEWVRMDGGFGVLKNEANLRMVGEAFDSVRSELSQLETQVRSDLDTLHRRVMEVFRSELSQLEARVMAQREEHSLLKQGHNTIAITDVRVVDDLAGRDALTGTDEGDVAIVRDNGQGVRESYIYTGNDWVSLSSPADVTEAELAAAVMAGLQTVNDRLDALARAQQVLETKQEFLEYENDHHPLAFSRPSPPESDEDALYGQLWNDTSLADHSVLKYWNGQRWVTLATEDEHFTTGDHLTAEDKS